MMDQDECYAWGEIFACEWAERVERMAARAEEMGMVQEALAGTLVWNQDGAEECRWVFVSDPSDVELIRAVYNDDSNIDSPRCFVVVTQPDALDKRGDVIFDMFELSPRSYLSHFHRVYTKPADNHA